MNLDTFDRMESEVRCYIRSFPTVFSKAKGSQLWDKDGKFYIDFFSGAGALNYGHNNIHLKEKLIEYLELDGVVHGLDMATNAKENFIKAFEEYILRPRNMDYVLQFTGPTGANAVEAALKLARKVKGRQNVIAFTNGFHGLSAGALAVTGNAYFRRAAGTTLGGASFMPYDGYFGANINTIDYLDRMLSDPSSGIDAPAAAIVETIQGEGGVHVASTKWLRALQECCRRHDMLLIVDDIQVGCGRSGRFFSFEESKIEPDIVTLSKSISGYGLPMSLVLIKPEFDQWAPGEHTGTFRGNNLAFVTATHALQSYWDNNELTTRIAQNAKMIKQWFHNMEEKYPDLGLEIRGKGMIHGISITGVNAEGSANVHRDIVQRAFQSGLIVETAGAKDDVLKLLPSLLIEEKVLQQGLQILEDCISLETTAAVSRPQVLETAL